MHMSRTLLLLLAAALSVACSKDPEPQPVQPPEPASTPAAASEDVHEFKIGELSAFALRDGGFVFPNDAKTVAINRSSEDVAKLLEAAGVPSTELSLSIQPLLIRSTDKVLLFDTGVGAGAGASGGKLVASMNEADIDPSSVTDIFISHAHGDHIGGLVDASGALVFANATVRISGPEWDSLKAAGAQDASRTALIQAVTPKVETFAPGAELVPGVVQAVDIKGHTPGHSGYLITSAGESLLYIGDMAHHYIVSVQEPDWTIQFDGDAPTAQASRKQVIADKAATGQRIYAVHFPFPGLGKFSQQADRYVWTPEQ